MMASRVCFFKFPVQIPNRIDGRNVNCDCGEDVDGIIFVVDVDCGGIITTNSPGFCCVDCAFKQRNYPIHVEEVQ